MVTDAQVRLLRQLRMEGKKQATAAASANMSERSARKWERGALPSETKKERWWRTRKDPFDEVWSTDIEPLLSSKDGHKLQALTILGELKVRYPSRFDDGQLRTLQRRVRDWRALHGVDKNVVFPQEHVPGREGAFDFTDARELGVTIGGVAFSHLLFGFKLSFSGWLYACMAFSESFEAMLRGLQGALWALGGAPAVLRSDNLSAATHELSGGGRALTKRYRAVLDHYGARSTRIRPGESHENGGVEKAHHLLKTALDQALILRGSRDFESETAYLAFVDAVVAKSNEREAVQARLLVEREHLKPLPSTRLPEYTTYEATVRCWSTVHVNRRTYSVPSRLIGHVVEARQYPDVVDIFYKGKLVERMPRLKGRRDVRIDYRHVIWSLARKPGAFARYKFREELFPSLVFRRAYDALKDHHGERCDIEYVRILHLAASTMESTVEHALQQLLDEGVSFDFALVKERVAPERPAVPEVTIPQPDLSRYDALLKGAR